MPLTRLNDSAFDAQLEGGLLLRPLPPSPPIEKATARKDQARQSRTGDGPGNAEGRTADRRGEESVMGAILVVGVLPPIWPALLPSK
jgi:hypothetical protein